MPGSAFERLSPALQYQIVNELGWKGIRPVQQACTHAVLDGDNCVVLAPTAGGKTEAAFFPLLTLMDQEDRKPVSTLYIAPIRALLNNQEARLERLTGLIGRRSFKWHGDVGSSARKRFVRDPADVLSITPESLEAMLMSTRVPAVEVLANVQAVVIDEVHAFAADDRGSHLMAVLERVSRLSGRDIQRIGLSATVGDPEAILAWMRGSSGRPGRVVDPGGAKKTPDLKLDFVGDLPNAALMIDRLYPGTKRLVFVDSRRRVEELGHHLSARKVDVYVTHSSLAASERHAAERAFEEGKNCVIVATSALELGIDVGELDHVVQVDAPSSVASFLQRMGRTGRRDGLNPNCTFLATTEDAVLRSAAILHLHGSGYIESTNPSRRSAHVLAHQLLALSMQERGVAENEWWSWLTGCGAFTELDDMDRTEVVEHMVDATILVSGDHRLMLGPRGEKLYGHRNFMELYAVFSSPPVLRVMHGNREVGTVDAWFLQLDEKPDRCAFVLAGRAWKISGIDWSGGVAMVEPADAGTYPSWFGRPILLSRRLCEAMRAVLCSEVVPATWSKRAAKVMAEMRESFAFLSDDVTAIQPAGDRVRWWTFAGGRANALLAACLRECLGDKVTANNLAVTIAGDAAKSDIAIHEAIDTLREEGALTDEVARKHAPDVARGRLSKFQPCLPERLERELQTRALLDVEGARIAVGLEVVVAEPDDEDLGGELDPIEELDVPAEVLAAFVSAQPPANRYRPRNPVVLVDTDDGLRAMVEALRAARVVGLDVETDTRDQSLALVQFATDERTWVVDPLAVPSLAVLAEVLASDAITKVIHNSSFERRVLGAVGLELVAVHDTLAESRRIRGKKVLGGHRLGSVCERELGLVLDKTQQCSNWKRRPLTQEQLEYAAVDAEVLVFLHRRLSDLGASPVSHVEARS